MYMFYCSIRNLTTHRSAGTRFVRALWLKGVLVALWPHHNSTLCVVCLYACAYLCVCVCRRRRRAPTPLHTLLHLMLLIFGETAANLPMYFVCVSFCFFCSTASKFTCFT